MRLELVDPWAPRVETLWRAVEAQARPPYFLTWGWIENWLACLPRGTRELARDTSRDGAFGALALAVVEHAGAPVAACFLGRRRLRRHGVVASRALYLNATGVPAYDELCIEHNGVLAASADPAATIASLITQLPGDWDELFLPAIDATTCEQLAAGALAGARLRIDREVADYQVDLARVREHGYVPLLGPSTRAQVRKAQRAAAGAIFEVAQDERAAADIYEDLVQLHQASWRQRGQPGAFADPWFDRFHRRLIAQRFRHGEIQLVRLRQGTTTLGCLYNLVASGRVLFYQCGFATPADRRIRPGYLCHAHAIDHCAREGHAIYDLLGGDARYKRSLATDERRLAWARVQRPRLVFSLEDRARAWLRQEV